MRFKKLHDQKVRQVQSFLEPRQRSFLDLLALLFHYNLPLLPGFISTTTPSGIQDYMPDGAALRAAQLHSKNFQLPVKDIQTFPIEGLYLMGSVGSIAFSKNSDIDIWLCHQSDLSEEQLIELQKKATAIESWATSLGLEVHFFLMDSKRFLLGEDAPLSSESSGKTQHYLLLEEFYRTAIYIAGKSPAWWLIPPHEEQHYSKYIQHLQANRFVFESELINFGGFEAVPAEEFVSATLWHIYKSLSSPHKSLLKLLLMECYASEYPNTEWLCQDIKRAVYQGDFAIADLDPYSLIYKKVEAYLQKKQSHERLELVRQCFYIKVMGSSTTAMDSQTRLAREQYLANLAKLWRWPPVTLNNLKKNQFWNIKKATQEHTIILKQLTHCYQIIMRFANAHIPQNRPANNDLKLIDRKLHAFLEKKPGKIEIITTRSAIHAKESELSIVEIATGWALYPGQVNLKTVGQFEQINQCSTFIEILGWLVVNGLYHKQLQLHISSQTVQLNKDELHGLTNDLNQFLIKDLVDEDSLVAYQRPRALERSLLIINLGIPLATRDDGMVVLSERSDPLSYGRDKQCLVESIDGVMLSNWGEITTAQYQGIEGLLTCFAQIINSTRKPLSTSDLTVICRTPVRAKGILARIQVVFDTLIKLFVKSHDNQATRYMLAGAEAFYVFQRFDQDLSYRSLPSQEQLLVELTQPQHDFSAVYFDPGVFENTPIPLIYRLNKAKIIQLFYAEEKGNITVYILDEKGSLFSQHHQQTNVHQLLNHYTDFLEAILARNLFEALLTLEYYEIQKSLTEGMSCTPVHLNSTADSPKLTLRIVGETVHSRTSYVAYCNDQEFSSLHYGHQVFNAVYQYILQFRTHRLDYPVYISDIDLPLAAFHVTDQKQLQTVHYLNYKQKIEAKLNS